MTHAEWCATIEGCGAYSCVMCERAYKAAKAQATAPNSPMPKCLCESCQNNGCDGVDPPFRGTTYTVHSCSGYSGTSA